MERYFGNKENCTDTIGDNVKHDVAQFYDDRLLEGFPDIETMDEMVCKIEQCNQSKIICKLKQNSRK